MIVKSLSLSNFRNYNHLFIEFNQDINILIGDNGQGKTNLIEAIYLLSVGKSFKTHIIKQMIMFDYDFAKVKGEVISNNKKRYLEIILGNDFKRAKIDDQDIYKISEYVGLLNVLNGQQRCACYIPGSELWSKTGNCYLGCNGGMDLQ